MDKTILLVEDEAKLRRSLQTALAGGGYRVLGADLIRVAWHLFATEKPDLVVLDLVLPDGDGLQLLQRIREHKELGMTPVIVLTGKSEMGAKVTGFKAGADQYLVKPVEPQELLLWAAALLRRLDYDAGQTDVLKAADLEIDPRARLVRFKGQTISYLTSKQFDLLYLLVRRRPQVLSRKFILSRLWHTITVDHVVNNQINNLRRLLPPELADGIQTVPGKGFRFLE